MIVFKSSVQDLAIEPFLFVEASFKGKFGVFDCLLVPLPISFGEEIFFEGCVVVDHLVVYENWVSGFWQFGLCAHILVERWVPL